MLRDIRIYTILGENMAKACKNCGSGGSQGMAPVGVDQQGFQQAQLQGNQYQPGSGTSFTPGPKGSFLKGSSGFIAQSPAQSPQQLGLSNNLINQAGGLINNLNDPNSRYQGFQPIAENAQNNWDTHILPSIMQRFANSTGGGQSRFGGGGYAKELSKANAESQLGIAALQSQYGLQNQGLMQQLLGQYLHGAYQPQFQTNYISPVQGALAQASPAIGRLLGGGLGAAAGGFFGGPAGAMAGASIGSGVGGLFENKNQ